MAVALFAALLGAFTLWLAPLSSGRALAPSQGRSFVVGKVGGTVLVTTPGGKSVALRGARLVRFGSTVDASQGIARVTVAAGRGKTYSGQFSKGSFTPRQSPTGVPTTEIRIGGDLCQRASIARRRPHLHRYLRAQAPPDFVVVGSSGSAQATSGVAKFTLADACAGATVAAGNTGGGTTAVADKSGNVQTASSDKRLQRIITPGKIEQLRCTRAAGYCVGLELETQGSSRGAYVPLLVTTHAGTTFQFCVTAPSAARNCKSVLFANPLFEDGVAVGGQGGGVQCQAVRAGNYAVTYRLNGVQLGPPLGFHLSSPARPAVNLPCFGPVGNIDENPKRVPLPTNLKAVTRLTLPVGVSIGFMTADLAPTGAQGNASIRGVVYADQGGAPGPLVAVTSPSVFNSSMPADSSFTLSFPPCTVNGKVEFFCHQLPAGTYWIGVLSGGDDRITTIGADVLAGSGAFNSNDFSAGPSDPFGPSTSEDDYLAVTLVYSPPGS